MPGNEILNTPLCPPFLPFLLGHHENNQASARESSGGVTTIRSSFQRHLFPERFLFFNSRDSLLHSAKCDRWNDGRSLDTQLVRRGEDEAASCWGRRIRLMEERWSNERIFGWRIFWEFRSFFFFFFLSRGVRGEEDSAWGKLRVKISIPLIVFAYNLSILRRKWVYDYSYWWRTDLVKLKRGWKLYLEALTPLLGIVKGVPFTHESGNFDKTSTRRVYVRRRFKVPTFVEHVIHPSSEIEERNVRDKKAKHEETLPTFPASYKNFENSVLFSTRKYSQGLLNPPNSPQLLATTRK